MGTAASLETFLGNNFITAKGDGKDLYFAIKNGKYAFTSKGFLGYAAQEYSGGKVAPLEMYRLVNETRQRMNV